MIRDINAELNEGRKEVERLSIRIGVKVSIRLKSEDKER